MESIDDLAVFYRKTNDEKTFLEIRRRLRPLITRRATAAIVIRERHLRADQATVYETGAKAGMSFQSVSRVGQRAIAKMRARLEARGLEADDVHA